MDAGNTLRNCAQFFEAMELSQAVLDVSKTGEERYNMLFDKVSGEMQEDLASLKKEAISSLYTLEVRSQEEKPYWTHLALNQLEMLHARMALFEKLESFRDLLLPNKSLEIVIGFCNNDEHVSCIREMLHSLSEDERKLFCQELELFFFCFLDPKEAFTVIVELKGYPLADRPRLIKALKDLFFPKILVRRNLLQLIIPHVYMLLDNPVKLQETRLQCLSFDEVQTMLTK